MGKIVSMGRIISTIINNDRILNDFFFFAIFFHFGNETVYEPVIKSGYIDISYGILCVKI